MAVFEYISRSRILPLNDGPIIDIRTVRLPEGQPPRQGSLYDPLDNRTPKNPLKLRFAYFNIVKLIFTPGMLQLPLAMGNAGIYTGVMATVVLTAIITHGQHAVIGSLNNICTILQIPHISYRYGCRIALFHGSHRLKTLAPFTPHLVAFFMFTTQIGHCCVNFVFVSNTIRDALDYPNAYTPMFMILLPLMILVFFMDNLSAIGKLALLGNLTGTIGMCITIYYFTRSGFSNINNISLAPIGVRRCIASFASIMFTVSHLTVVLGIDRALEDPRHITTTFGIINVGTLLPCVCGFIFGLMGHLQYGLLEDNVLRALPRSETLAHIANWVYALSVMLACPIPVFAATDLVREVYTALLKDSLEIDERHIQRVQHCLRPSLIFLVFCISLILPYQMLYVMIVGTIAGPILTIIGPALMDIGLRHPDKYGTWQFFYYSNMLILIFGLVIVASGFLGCVMTVYTNRGDTSYNYN